MLARLVRDRDAGCVSKLIARPDNEILKGILRNEITVGFLYSLTLFPLRAVFRVRLPIGLFINFKNYFDLVLGERTHDFLNLSQVVFSQPVPKKLIGHIETNFIFISRDKGDRFNPGLVILPADPFFDLRNRLRPQLWHKNYTKALKLWPEMTK